MLRYVLPLGLLLALTGCVPLNPFGGSSWSYPYYTPYYGGPYSGPYTYPNMAGAPYPGSSSVPLGPGIGVY
jgi:hypothetical protein